MSHIAEVYAKDLGVKIGKPKITEHFYPLLQDKFILIGTQDEIKAHNYDYWGLVVNLLEPILEKYNINVIEIHNGDNRSLKQKNFMLRKSLGYFGVSNHYAQIADTYGKPSVCIVGNTYPEVCQPAPTSKMISPDFSKIKPSFALEENPKRINEIKAEEIAQSVLDALNIDEKIKFKTIYIGANSHQETIEIVPDFKAHINQDMSSKTVLVRGDLHYDIDNISFWSHSSPNVLFLKQEIPADQIGRLSRNTRKVVLKVDSAENNYEDFLNDLKKYNIPSVLVTENEEIVNDLRLKYFDFQVLLSEYKDVSDLVNENTKFISNKTFINAKDKYISEFCADRLDNSINFVLNDISKQELESLYLYE